ncbi:outer membrane beta-barrel protein [uncultured Desulfovibrio sp.]|uniref:outer membrane protein n=1 Tax=uncultured Desulfovibrio sp. TaxID=167968 RepID=UPI002629DEC4|nr:outer membrane beta-barrel protein [uncultured Desulfovibrio sp.]
MFKKTLCALALTLAMATSAFAAENGFYVGLKFIDSIQSTGTMSKGGGANLFDISDYTQNTIGGGAFIGYDFYPVYQVPVRAEIEYAIRTNSTTSWDDKFGAGADVQGEWGLQTLFLNAYWDFHNSTNFTPYIGAGVGMAFINSKYEVEMDGWSDSVQETNTVFAWNAGVGCAYAFTDNLSADLAYRFVGLGYTETEKTFDGVKTSLGHAPYANEFSLGIRYTF